MIVHDCCILTLGTILINTLALYQEATQKCMNNVHKLFLLTKYFFFLSFFVSMYFTYFFQIQNGPPKPLQKHWNTSAYTS